MTTESSKNQNFIRKHPSEGMDALEKESKLPLKGWETEVILILFQKHPFLH